MRLIDKTPRVSRRDILRSAGATLVAVSVLPGGAVTGRAWAAMPRAVAPETYATLVQMSRDIYPHDKLSDRFYAAAVDIVDEAARADEEMRRTLEDGVAGLDRTAEKRHGVKYGAVGWEADRVALLEEIETTPFFQTVRGNLVTGLYNNKELWPLFGYEGASAPHGGYINRGFDDISWV